MSAREPDKDPVPDSGAVDDGTAGTAGIHDADRDPLAVRFAGGARRDSAQGRHCLAAGCVEQPGSESTVEPGHEPIQGEQPGAALEQKAEEEKARGQANACGRFTRTENAGPAGCSSIEWNISGAEHAARVESCQRFADGPDEYANWRRRLQERAADSAAFVAGRCDFLTEHEAIYGRIDCYYASTSIFARAYRASRAARGSAC